MFMGLNVGLTVFRFRFYEPIVFFEVGYLLYYILV